MKLLSGFLSTKYPGIFAEDFRTRLPRILEEDGKWGRLEAQLREMIGREPLPDDEWLRTRMGYSEEALAVIGKLRDNGDREWRPVDLRLRRILGQYLDYMEKRGRFPSVPELAEFEKRMARFSREIWTGGLKMLWKKRWGYRGSTGQG